MGRANAPGNGSEFLARIRKRIKSVDNSAEVPSIHELAESCNLSARSLQRRLEDENVSYRQLWDEVLFERAVSLMQDPAVTTTEISNRLGYPYPGNFTRAFKRTSGVSPDCFRSLYL